MVRTTKVKPTFSTSLPEGLPFHVSVAAWIDLLAYGRMIGSSGMNPADPRAEEAVRRLRAFQAIVASHSDRFYRTLVLNDGAVAYRDLSTSGAGPTCAFLERSFALHRAVNAIETTRGWAGARMVLSAGLRAKGSKRSIDASAREVNRILARLDAGKLTPREAVLATALIQRHSDQIPQLQANFAFSRAYIADDAGSGAGLGGAGLFVDTALFIDGIPPNWIEARPTIPFCNPTLGVACEFAPIKAIRANRPKHHGDGLRNGTEVGLALAPTFRPPNGNSPSRG